MIAIVAVHPGGNGQVGVNPHQRHTAVFAAIGQQQRRTQLATPERPVETVDDLRLAVDRAKGRPAVILYTILTKPIGYYCDALRSALWSGFTPHILCWGCPNMPTLAGTALRMDYAAAYFRNVPDDDLDLSRA